MTNEEIKKILDGARDSDIEYDPICKAYWGKGMADTSHQLADLRRILEQDAIILELRQEVERLREAADLAFYNGYVRGVTFEKEGHKNHSEFLSEIAEDECRKYLDSEFYATTNYPTEGE